MSTGGIPAVSIGPILLCLYHKSQQILPTTIASHPTRHETTLPKFQVKIAKWACTTIDFVPARAEFQRLWADIFKFRPNLKSLLEEHNAMFVAAYHSLSGLGEPLA